MKSKLLIGMFVALVLSACNSRKAVIRDELRVIENDFQGHHSDKVYPRKRGDLHGRTL